MNKMALLMKLACSAVKWAGERLSGRVLDRCAMESWVPSPAL